MAGKTLESYPLIKQAVTATASGALTLGSAVTGFKGYGDYTWQEGISPARVPYFFVAGSEWEYGVGEYATSGKITRNCIVQSSTTGGISLSTGATGVITDSPLPMNVGWFGGGHFTQSDSFTATGGGNIPWGADTSSYSSRISWATGQCDIPCWASRARFTADVRWSPTTGGGNVTLTSNSPIGSTVIPVSHGRAVLTDDYATWFGDGGGNDYTTWSLAFNHSGTGDTLAVDSYLTIQFIP